MARLAEVLEFPVSFFCAEELSDLPVDTVSFRALSKTPAGLRDSAIGIGRLAVRLFDLAHELGHLVLHCEHQVTNSREAEQQAQRFASAFLMPREDLIARPLWHLDATRIIKEKRRWRVAAMALAHRLHDLGMLTEWGYRDACVTLSQAGFRRGEPQGGIVPETSQVWGKVFHSLRSRGVVAKDVADDVDLTVTELNRLVFGLVPIALEGEDAGGGERATLRVIQGGAQVPVAAP